MGRIRTLKPEFWSNEHLSALPEATHMLAAALLNYADDEGYFNANERLVQAACCPLREPSVSIHGSLKQLESIGYLKLGNGSDGRVYGWIVNFEKHQRVNRPSPSKIRELVSFTEPSLSPHGMLSEPSLLEQGTGNREEEQGTGSVGASNDAPSKQPRKRFIPPTLAEVQAYCRERRNTIDPQQFIDHYTANGWRVGKNPMKDWRAAVRTWEKNQKEQGYGTRNRFGPGPGQIYDPTIDYPDPVDNTNF